MKITAIKQQVRRADRYSISLDGKYVFSLSETELLKLGLRIGQELSETESQSLRDEAVLDKAYDSALNLIMRRPRSRWELEDYLKRKDYAQAVIEGTISNLTDRGYVDDYDFARRWVENRHLLKATSKRRLAQELRQKRVSDEVIDQVLEEDETDELEVLKELVERKRKQSKYQDDLKLMQYLARQGFSYDLIKQALEG
jgi:regulatory protein